MSQFRSEKMELIQLFIQSEAAHGTLHELGEVGAVQFKDLNVEKSAFQRLFVSDVRRCDDMLRILRIFADALVKEKMPARPDKALSPGSVVELHEKLTELEKEIKEHNVSFTALKTQRQELDEHCRVLKQGAKWFQNAYTRGVSFTSPTQEADASGVEMMEGGGGAQKTGMLGHIAGCCATSGIADLARTLFRATRGNMLLKHEEIEDLNTDDHDAVSKSVFVVFFSGDRSRSKIGKICDSFNSNKYKLPESQQQQTELLTQVEERLRDLSLVIDKTHEYRRSKLSVVRDSVAPWTEHVKRELGVFHTLNMFNYDVTHKCLIAEGWCPTEDLNDVREALRRGTAKSGATVQTVLNVVRFRETPPTFFRNSKVAQGTQKIVDAYGMARYQEFNPATFSVITFPFLFGVMFGDIGHGIMMTLAGILLVLYEKRLAPYAADEMFGTLYKGRYNILLMGIFATYCGFIYNEVFAVPFDVMGKTLWCSGENAHDEQCMAIPGNDQYGMQKWKRTTLVEAYDFVTNSTTGEEVVWDVYPMGTDPGFAHTGNKLNSVNSFKMKFAIIAGVIQMVAGVNCKLMNTLHFRDRLTMWFVYIPEMVFINSIFGYLCCLILIKWLTNWDATYVLNNSMVVSIPQVYCEQDLSNMPCWSAPFVYNPADLNYTYNGAPALMDLPPTMWCMKGNTPSAGCAIMEWEGKLIVEGNVFGNTTMPDPMKFNADGCRGSSGLEGCLMYKQNPPSLLDTLIKMFMELGSVAVSNQVIPGQGPLQIILILMAFISVPMLLLPKPYILKWRHEAAQHHQLHDEDEQEASGGGGHGDGHEFDFGEEMVHQMIHTIEYVLGCISNTASYLRLWALSLAHAQLSEVFWEKTVVDFGLAPEGGDMLMLFCTIAAWAAFTVGVLMGMESLSAFLHALRLHWVEFMNKFYFGDGYKFMPFAFDNLDDLFGGTAD
ncbi:V-type ATPase, V0 complex, 116kDa subunit family [Baffinella frigidus]|nr:V-type ATPase, V0 complex, 116kDa subunit family [Cryptophyta sp. CCMP2293]|mmetsp:Transcript_30853/g.73308  ORF Transcript_30853/g.73308 Transcript_30853/m.73308 type:complete len:946 (-) Transcript_30853:58-2895(-)